MGKEMSSERTDTVKETNSCSFLKNVLILTLEI